MSRPAHVPAGAVFPGWELLLDGGRPQHVTAKRVQVTLVLDDGTERTYDSHAEVEAVPLPLGLEGPYTGPLYGRAPTTAEAAVRKLAGRADDQEEEQ